MQRASKIVELDDAVLPFDALALYRDDPYVALLESLGPSSRLGRYTYLCVDPFLIVRSKRRECLVGPPGALEPVDRDLFTELGRIFERYAGGGPEWTPDLPPFLGGAVGYLGYELLYLIENIDDLGRDDLSVPDAYLMFCHTVIVNDRVTQRTWVVTTAFASSAAEAEELVAEKHRETIRRLATLPPSASPESSRRIQLQRDEVIASRRKLTQAHLDAANVRPVVTREQYIDIVKAAKEHIAAGDIFEVCTSQRFDTEFEGSGETLYGVLRSVNSSPFAAYLRFPELEVASSSPERFLSLDRERWVETRPIKGTRPRSAIPEEDARQYNDLATCEKDHAENIMIVDLARNDLGRVCEFGSINVPDLRVIEPYPFTYQLVSTVRGRLRRDVTPVELVKAAFPGGSMTGAPKVESMKIIDRLEPVKRGVFSGSIGFIDYDGAFDLNIVIRTIVKRGDQMSFHVGGAIVYDSDPAEEYQETLDKAHGLVTALELARKAAGTL